MGPIVRFFQEIVTAIVGEDSCEEASPPPSPALSPVEVQTDFQDDAEALRAEAALEESLGNMDRARQLRFQARIFEDFSVTMDRFNQSLQQRLDDSYPSSHSE